MDIWDKKETFRRYGKKSEVRIRNLNGSFVVTYILVATVTVKT